LRELRRALPRERRCLICAQVHAPTGRGGAAALCAECRDALPRRRAGYCPACGDPAPWPEAPIRLCRRCRASPPPWQDILFHGVYETGLRRMLLALKFGGDILLGHALGCLLAEHPALASMRVDAVVPIPLHPARLARRGYNQSLEIARPVARAAGARLWPGCLSRVKATAAQSGQSREQRFGNIRGAFACRADVRGKRLLLVDDILTTGATMEAACLALLRAGAAETSLAVVSRASLRHEPLRRE
jgi:ComF family protein